MGLTMSYGPWVLYRTQLRRALRRELVRIGIPVCVICGYDLRGQTVARCSECGTASNPALLGLTPELTVEVPAKNNHPQ